MYTWRYRLRTMQEDGKALHLFIVVLANRGSLLFDDMLNDR